VTTPFWTRSAALSPSLTGYLPETDASGKEKWPKGDEKVWKAGMRNVDKGAYVFFNIYT
jgi:hypothetical protein